MKLYEIFDTKIENLVWHRYMRHIQTTFKVDNIKYVIQIEIKSLGFPELKGKKCGEVVFYIDGDDIEPFSTQNKNIFSPKVYGVVLNALIDKIYEFDTIYFSAERRHSMFDKDYKQKVKIYQFICDRVMKSSGHEYIKYYRKISGATEFLLSKTKIVSGGYINEFNKIKEAMELQRTLSGIAIPSI